MASGKANSASANVLKIIYQAVTWTSMAINATSSPFTNIYVQLSTGTLSATSDQTTTEATYTSYARVAVSRDTGGWSISSQTISNVAAISFPACTGSSSTVTYFSCGTASSGAGTVTHWGALTASLAITNGITPSFAIGALTVTES